MRNRPALALFFAAVCVGLAHAQMATPAPEVTGSISGHVICADTNEPARFATVMLQPAPQRPEATPEKRADQVVQSGPPATRTGLDGSFSFSKVKPGTYFLIADYAGYVSPLAKLSPKEIASKEPADIEKVEKALVQITVAANKDSARDLELERGSAISGTIRYDDGSPANEIQVAVLRVSDDGKISPVSFNLGSQMRSALRARGEGLETNDLGHYRISGLPAGKYIVEATLPTEISSYGGMYGGPVAAAFRIEQAAALSVYTGNVVREKDAKPVEVVAGDARDGVDITIPLLGMHTVSGSVTALADGHAVNSGTVSLLFADDKSELRASNIPEDGSFNFRFVPEGEYILRITNPGDFIEEVQDTQQGGLMRSDYRQTHSYASVDQPISVHADVTNLNISVPDKPASTAQKQ